METSGESANLNLADENEATPLMHAAEVGNIKMLKGLLNAGANVDAADGTLSLFSELF